ncbi:MAG: hypothetical protein JJ863_34615 [Deltaproteobacteria bacterium]|nr:hypothetical protein [Deltaproteobacteria bacterium]
MDTVDGRGRTSKPRPRVLIVGAGAVGQVYGMYLQRGGAVVDVLARPRQKEELEEGATLYKMRGKRGREPMSFRPSIVHVDPATTVDVDYDQIWLCISSTGLEKGLDGGGLDVMFEHAGRATVVVFQSGLHIPALLAPHVADMQIVDGGIMMVSYQAPLTEGEVDHPGVAFYMAGPQPFTGRDAKRVVRLLEAGDCPAEEVEDARATMAFSSATLMPTITALEGAGWTFSKMRSGPWAGLASSAAGEARDVVAAQTGKSAPAALNLVLSPTLKLASFLAPILAPFEVEIYLKYHFTKVHDQTERLIDDYIARADELGVSKKALTELRTQVFGPIES